MVERLAQKCSRYMISIGAADPQNSTALTYGIFQIFSGILHILLLFVAGIASGLIDEVAAFSLAFYTLKIYIGGVHTKHHWQCLILFTLMALIGGAIGNFLSVPALAVSFSIGTCIAIFWFAPVPHPNHPVSERQYVLFKRKCRYMVLIHLIITIGLICIGSIYAMSWTLGGVAAAITLIRKRRGVKT